LVGGAGTAPPALMMSGNGSTAVLHDMMMMAKQCMIRL